jgi:hypothetical protein
VFFRAAGICRWGVFDCGNGSLSCVDVLWRMAKTFSIYVCFNLIIRVSVIKLSNGIGKLR